MAAARELTIRTRARRPGPELEMLDAALRGWQPTDGRDAPIVLREPELPTGCPDIVAIYRRADAVKAFPARRRLTVHHLQLLEHLHTTTTTRVGDLAVALFASARLIERLLADLVDAALVTTLGDVVRPEPLSAVFAVERIIAIEAKIHGWREAVEQAVANIWFASHSYILLPPRRRIEPIIAEVQRHGVGLLFFDGTTTVCAAPATTHPLPGSYGSWMLNEWLLRDELTVTNSDRDERHARQPAS